MERYGSSKTSTGTQTRLTGGLLTRFRTTGQDELGVWWLRIGFPAKDCHCQSTSSSVTAKALAVVSLAMKGQTNARHTLTIEIAERMK